MTGITTNTSSVFPRQINGPAAPLAVDGHGAWVVDREGKEYLDASGGAFVSILGYNPPGMAVTLSKSLKQLNFTYSGHFTNGPQEALAERLIQIAPQGIGKAILTSSGSTANETAMKLARQYHIARGMADKHIVISRRHSYHGSTMGALTLTGSMPRRRPFEPYLCESPKVTAPDPANCPADVSYSQFVRQCASELDETIVRCGPRNVSAFIVEPISGAPLAALPTPDEYLQLVRQICDDHNVLLIVDEVVSGMGRTGDWFAVARSGIVPDIITLAKGLGAGYVPIGAVLCQDRIFHAFQDIGASLVHSESFTGHSLLGAAGLATISYIESNGLLNSNAYLGSVLQNEMAVLEREDIVGSVRGRGMLAGLTLVADKTSASPYSRRWRVSERIAEECLKNGLLVQAGNAAHDGINGDAIALAPPYVTTEVELHSMVSILEQAIQKVSEDLLYMHRKR